MIDAMNRAVDSVLEWSAALSPAGAALFFLALNVALFAGSLLLGHLIIARFGFRRVTDPPSPLERQEVVLAALCVVLNAGVTLAGWFLWRDGVITARRGVGWRIGLDALVLFILMDAAMYLLHRLAHLRWVYPWLHRAHHRYDRPRPLNLFVLSPLEVLAFGALWLVVLRVYPASFVGIGLYLALNLLFGTLGHVGVEPFPNSWLDGAAGRHLGSSTFHAGHHQHEHVNFGFYTTLWDRLFGTLGMHEPRR
jgi:sterol desaturase/sphingolipid hydroxylase (fatty acid hydroxylase superfamily)